MTLLPPSSSNQVCMSRSVETMEDGVSMKGVPVIVLALFAVIGAGCVAQATHKKVLADLKMTQGELAATQEQMQAEKEQAAEELAAADREKAKLSNELLQAQTALAQARTELDRTTHTLAKEQEARRDLGEKLIKVQSENRQIEGLSGELRRERDQLKNRSDDLERRLETAQQDWASAENALAETIARNEALLREKDELGAAVTQARTEARDLQTQFEAEQAQVAALQEDKQRLLTGTSTAQEEIARLQIKAGKLETAAALARDLAQQLSERDQEIGALRQAAAETEGLTATVATQREELDTAKQRILELTEELATLSDRTASTVRERDELERQVNNTATEVQELVQAQRELERLLDESRAARETEAQRLAETQIELGRLMGTEEVVRAQLEQERAAKETEVARLTEAQLDLARSLDNQQAKLERLAQERRAQEAEIESLKLTKRDLLQSLESHKVERERLEREKAAKDDEIRRLRRTHEELTESLRAEIAKGNIKIQQVRDRLTINMLDRVLFDSGRAEIKPDGLKVLKQVSDVLNKMDDKQIRIEGHTDNVPIGPKIKHRFATNWELSTARATSVVRYLVDKGRVDPDNLTAAGYADTRPVSSNDNALGRALNRRIEIALYPKDFTGILQ